MRLNNIMENIPEIISYLIIGLISMITGGICINIIVEKDKRAKYNSPSTYFLLFFISILVHIIVQSVNLDQIYCDKLCQMRLKK